jgi:hypothetical protein
MTVAGWVLLTLGWSFALGLAGYCLVRTLREG